MKDREALIKELTGKSKEMRFKILDIAGKCENTHVPSAMSCCDIVTALYFHYMNYDPKNTLDENRDRFILSAGHKSMVQYADFGVSLASGFRKVMEKWDSYDMLTIGRFLLNVASSIASSTGGCSGPVWGTLFMTCGKEFREKTEISIKEAACGLQSAIEAIMKRGGAHIGDKTLLDALQAIVDVLAKAEEDTSVIETLDEAAKAAYETREITKEWVAKRGRQSFTGDRSIGTYDPGIVAIGDMSVAIVKALKE